MEKVKKIIDKQYKENSDGCFALVETSKGYAIGWGINWIGLDIDIHNYSIEEFTTLEEALKAWEKKLYHMAREGYNALSHEKASIWAANRIGFLEAKNTSEYAGAYALNKDHEKQVRRRIEDALRKNTDFAILLEICELLRVNTRYYPVCNICKTKQNFPYEGEKTFICYKCGKEQKITE